MSALKYIFHSLLCLVGLQRIVWFFFLLQALCANTRVQSVSKFPELVAVAESRAENEKSPLPWVKVTVPNLCGAGNFCVFSSWQGS